MNGLPGTLKRISKATMTDLVEQSLQTYFKERALKPGDPLPKDIFELRLVIEIGLGDILFARKTEKDLKELEAIAKKQIKDKPHTFRIKNEIEFHGKLYEMTGNDTLKRFQNMLLPIFGYVMISEKKEHRSGKVTH